MINGRFTREERDYLASLPAVAGDLPYERLAGSSGVETSLAVAKHTWGTDWKVVYVASNRNPVDALPAATIGDGPVVLTDGNSLNLGGVKPGKIVILGGTGAVPQGIEDQAKATGAEVLRLKGADRNGTAAAIAKQWVAVNGTPKNAYITKNVGSGSPDAVAASVLRDGPILTFTNDASANALAGVVAELKAPKVTALGGTGVVPDAVVSAAAAGKATARLAGANRYETAFEIAKYAKGQKNGSNVYLASGTALKDAMVAGAAKDGVILLSPANGEGVKAKADALGATKLIVIGGTKVMPDRAVQAAATGIIPKPKLQDMTLEEMRAAYPLAGEQQAVPEKNLRAGSYDYCIGDTGASLMFVYSGLVNEPLRPYPHYRFAEPMTGMTAQKYHELFPLDSVSDWQEIIDDAKGYGFDPSVLYGFGSGAPKFVTKFLGDSANLWEIAPSQCRKGAEHPEWAKPFPMGKRLEHIDADNINSYSCAAEGKSVKCFYWGKDYAYDGYPSMSNPGWWSHSED